MDEMVDRLLDILADKLTERLSAGHKELYTAKELAERYGVSCATMDCFVQDDDGNGTLRGELVGSIQRCLERRDADYQTRWNRVWASALCQKYRRPESEDYWLWARAFFDAPIFDLQAIAALVQ